MSLVGFKHYLIKLFDIKEYEDEGGEEFEKDGRRGTGLLCVGAAGHMGSRQPIRGPIYLHPHGVTHYLSTYLHHLSVPPQS